MNIIDLEASFIDRPMLMSDRSIEPLLNAFDNVNMSSIKLDASASNNGEIKLDANGNCTIPIIGTLTHRRTIFDNLLGLRSYQSIREDLRAALALEPKTILFDIDSGGGAASGAFDLHREIKEITKHTRIIALCNGSTFSAAYLLASACSEIWMTQSARAGSIGVVSAHVDVSKKNEKDGLKVTYVYKGDRKVDLSPHKKLSDKARANLQNEIDRTYNMFVDAVAEARPGLTASAVRATEAGIFDAESAIANGLADRLVSEYDLEKELKTSKPSPVRNAAPATYKPSPKPLAASAPATQKPTPKPAPKIDDLPQAAENPALLQMLKARGTSIKDAAAILAAAQNRG